MKSIHLIFWDHVRLFRICWAMNASCKAYKPSFKSNYKRWKNRLPWFSVACVLWRKFDELEFYASLMRSEKYWILRIQSWFVTNCTKKLSGKSVLQWTSWLWIRHKSWEQTKCMMVSADRFLCVKPERAWSTKTPNNGLSRYNRHKLWATGICE